MGKRKAAAAAASAGGGAALPAAIAMAPAGGPAPLVVYFPSGFDPTAAPADAAVEWRTFTHEKRPAHVAVVARTAHNVDFVGTSMGPEYSAPPPCRFALGVLDRAAGTLALAPVAAGRVLRMEPRARALSYASAPAPALTTDGDRRERNARLVDEFGSQRRKRQLTTQRAAAVDAGQVSAGGEVLAGLAAAAGATPSKEAVVAATLAARNVPPHDAAATTPDEAYPWAGLVPGAVRGALDGGALLAAAGDAERRAALAGAPGLGAGYALSRAAGLARGPPEGRAARAAGLALLGHLLALLRAGPGALRARKGEAGAADVAARLGIAPGALEGLCELFYQREVVFDEDAAGGAGARFAQTAPQRERMLAWALVLALRVEPENALDAEGFVALAEELRMKPADVVARFRECGAAAAPAAGSSGRGRGAAFRVALLAPGAGAGAGGAPRTLGESFPGLKRGGKKR